MGATNELLGQFSYNAQHALTVVAGQTNRLCYSANGQLLAATNALGQKVTLSYNSDGYGALPGATTGFTYDGTNRLRTVTDSEGYTVTFDYDALDPDATFEQFVYPKEA